MIRMCDKDGDGQVSFVEFYEMVTGGKSPPLSLLDTLGWRRWTGAPKGMAAGGGPSPVIQQRNARRMRWMSLLRSIRLSLRRSKRHSNGSRQLIKTTQA